MYRRSTRSIPTIGLQFCRAFDDLCQHRAGFAALGWSVGKPYSGRVFGEDILEIAFALHAEGGELGDVQLPGPFVAMFDQQPAAGSIT
jgi:hypothetical protein